MISIEAQRYVESIQLLSLERRADGQIVRTFEVAYQADADPKKAESVAIGIAVDRVLSQNF